MRNVYLFDRPERFVAGTVGQPGERTFFLQAKQAGRITSVVVEKQQVQLLAHKLDQLLDRLEEVEGIAATAPHPADLEPLDHPIVEEFRVGVLAIGWNTASGCIVLEAHDQSADEVPDIEEDVADGPDVLRVRITPEYCRGFCRRALALVDAGRKSCPLCLTQLDSAGHICPRTNGYRRRG